MKINFTIFFSLFVLLAKAATWDVEVGGTSLVTPYYAPQNLTIQVGDNVMWTFVSGFHNVTSTSGPAAFASGDRVGNSNGSVTYSFIFNLPGTYTYNCTFKGHSQFQFGTIVVEGTVRIKEEIIAPTLDFVMWPNPASDFLTVEKNNSSSVDISIKDITGKTVYIENSVADLRKEISLNSLNTGIYFVELRQRNQVIRKKLVIR